MKKLCFLILVTMAFKANAQSSYGFSGGINAAQVSSVLDYSQYHAIDVNDPILLSGKVKQTSGAVLPSFGVFYVKDFDPSIGIKTELMYQGFGSIKAYPSMTNVNLSYLMLPVSFYYRQRKNFSFSEGIYGSWLLDKNSVREKGIPISRTDFGISVGFSVRIVKSFWLGLTGYGGIEDIFVGPGYTGRNRAVQLKATWDFGKKMPVFQ